MTGRLVRHLAGGALRIDADAGVRAPVEAWLPLSATAVAGEGDGSAGARIRIRRGADSLARSPEPGTEAAVSQGEGPAPVPETSVLLRLGTVVVRVAGSSDRSGTFALEGDHGLRGFVAPDRARSELNLPSAEAEADTHFALTVASALLLARVGRALIHAAAVVPPSGAALLLVGDSRSGKSTTSANLARGGWTVLTDDHAVLSWSGGPDRETHVEGWLRPFHLDPGWLQGRRTGGRVAVDPDRFTRLREPDPAPLGGLLFPHVRPDEPTRLAPLSPADALAGLIRQSPWLFADPAAAPDYLERMTRAASRPAFTLSLGSDSYDDPVLLADVLAPAVAGGGGPG